MKYVSKSVLYEIIDFIRHNLGIEACPPDPFEIQRLCGDSLHLKFHKFGSVKIGGLLIKNLWPEPSCMVLNSAKPPLSQRFDCAHELMHFFLHPAGREYMCETMKEGGRAYEYQANEGAAELLLPYRQFIPHFLELCADASSRRGLVLLAEIYGVSLTVIQYRVNSLTYEMDQYLNGCALQDLRILSRGRQPRGEFKSKELQVILSGVNKGIEPLPDVPRFQNPRFECVEYEEELIESGFYESYYRGC